MTVPAVEHLSELMVDAGILHAVRLRHSAQKKRKGKFAAATYQYQADCDGEWCKIQFDFEDGSADIIRLAD